MFNPLFYLYVLYASRPKQAKLKGSCCSFVGGLVVGLVWFHWLDSYLCARCVALLLLLLLLLVVRVSVCLCVCLLFVRLFVYSFPHVAGC